MKKSMNRFVCGLTAAVMMGTLTACSGGQGETKPAAPAGSESAGNSESAAQQGEDEAEQGQLSLFEVVESPKKEKTKVEVKVEYVNPYEDIIKELDQIDLYQLTPMQAMNVMYELKVKMNQRK